MYIVVSKWKINPGMEDQFMERGRKMRNFMRSQPGVEMVEAFRCEDGCSCAILGYKDEESYRRLVKDPNGPFERAAKENGLEEMATWQWSERGEAIDREPAIA